MSNTSGFSVIDGWNGANHLAVGDPLGRTQSTVGILVPKAPRILDHGILLFNAEHDEVRGADQIDTETVGKGNASDNAVFPAHNVSTPVTNVFQERIRIC